MSRKINNPSPPLPISKNKSVPSEEADEDGVTSTSAGGAKVLVGLGVEVYPLRVGKAVRVK